MDQYKKQALEPSTFNKLSFENKYKNVIEIKIENRYERY